MTVEELQKLHPNDPRVQSQQRINKSRNYIRFQLSRNRDIDSGHPLLTSEEQDLVKEYNNIRWRLLQLKVQLFTKFYDNCTEVGSTLKRKDHKVEVIDNSFIPKEDW